MKINRDGKPPIIIGKRVTLNGLMGSIASILSFYYPDHAPAIVASATVITFFLQVAIANLWGVTDGGPT